MRYHSLRFVSGFLKLVAVFVALLNVVIFFWFEAVLPQVMSQMVIGGTRIIFADGVLTARVIPLVFLIWGFIASVCIYAGGAFIILMIDIEQGVRNIDYHFNNREPFEDDHDPLTPRQWANPVTDSPYMPPPKGRSGSRS